MAVIIDRCWLLGAYIWATENMHNNKHVFNSLGVCAQWKGLRYKQTKAEFIIGCTLTEHCVEIDLFLLVYVCVCGGGGGGGLLSSYNPIREEGMHLDSYVVC